jgi:hypothetical protein
VQTQRFFSYLPVCIDLFCGSPSALLYTAHLAQLKVLEVLCRGLSEGRHVQMARLCYRGAEVKWDGYRDVRWTGCFRTGARDGHGPSGFLDCQTYLSYQKDSDPCR